MFSIFQPFQLITGCRIEEHICTGNLLCPILFFFKKTITTKYICMNKLLVTKTNYTTVFLTSISIFLMKKALALFKIQECKPVHVLTACENPYWPMYDMQTILDAKTVLVSQRTFIACTLLVKINTLVNHR